MANDRRLIMEEDPKSAVAEAFRTFRTNLQFAQADTPVKTVLFTSAGPGEGKSSTIGNTAVALAQTGKRVILVDCDLRKPVLHRMFGLDRRGLTNVLVGDLPLEEALQTTRFENLRILASGPVPPNPSELLGSARMVTVLADLSSEADYVLLDTPPAVAMTDASLLASRVDGVVLVLEAGVIRPEMAQRACDQLRKAQGHILGVVLNRAEIEAEHAYYYYYYYGEEGREKKEKKDG